MFTQIIGFIVCNFDCKSMSLMRNWHRQLVLSRDNFSNYLKQHNENFASGNCFIEIHIVNMIKESNFSCCSSHILYIMLSYYNFHQTKTWLTMATPYLQRRLFRSPNMQRSLLNLFNLAEEQHFPALECHKGKKVCVRNKRAIGYA